METSAFLMYECVSKMGKKLCFSLVTSPTPNNLSRPGLVASLNWCHGHLSPFLGNEASECLLSFLTMGFVGSSF